VNKFAGSPLTLCNLTKRHTAPTSLLSVPPSQPPPSPLYTSQELNTFLPRPPPSSSPLLLLVISGFPSQVPRFDPHPPAINPPSVYPWLCGLGSVVAEAPALTSSCRDSRRTAGCFLDPRKFLLGDWREDKVRSRGGYFFF
jgi:hypothetical protein